MVYNNSFQQQFSKWFTTIILKPAKHQIVNFLFNHNRVGMGLSNVSQQYTYMRFVFTFCYGVFCRNKTRKCVYFFSWQNV
uniref:Uncharacterized protein n=1 Tax=viral metagenome TaxID=1070528 RepID=A0A6C0H7U5_9ZZZZ